MRQWILFFKVSLSPVCYHLQPKNALCHYIVINSRFIFKSQSELAESENLLVELSVGGSGRLKDGYPQDVHIWIPGTCECYFTWQKALCTSEQVKDLEMEWITLGYWVSPMIYSQVSLQEEGGGWDYSREYRRGCDNLSREKEGLKMLCCELRGWRKKPRVKECQEYSSRSWKRQGKDVP